MCSLSTVALCLTLACSISRCDTRQYLLAFNVPGSIGCFVFLLKLIDID